MKTPLPRRSLLAMVVVVLLLLLTDAAHAFVVPRAAIPGRPRSTGGIMMMTSTDGGSNSETNDDSLWTNLVNAATTLARLADPMQEIEYQTYSSHPEFPDVDLSAAPKLFRGFPPFQYLFTVGKTLRTIQRIGQIVLGVLVTYTIAQCATVFLYDAQANPLTKYQALFTNNATASFLDWVPRPPDFIVSGWESDAEFARQFLAGLNPVVVQVVRQPQRQLTPVLYQHLQKDKSKNLQQLAKAGNLFVADYEWLDDLPVNPHQARPLANNPDSQLDDPRYFQAPQVVLEKDAATGTLMPVAIQLLRNETKVYQPPASSDSSTTSSQAVEWLYAKMCVTEADGDYHNWVSHLGMTHMTMEAPVIAIHNTLQRAKMADGKPHPLYTFFQPMTKDALQLQFMARNTLARFGQDSFGDRQSSVGVGQFFQLVGKYWSSYDFFESSALDRELANRGFDESVELKDYWFRKDGLKLWKALGDFAADFVAAVYPTDEAVAADADLQAWAQETASPDKARVPGFPAAIESRELLIRTMQTLYWIASGLHSAFNYPQYEYYAYQPNKPQSLRLGPYEFHQQQERLADDPEALRAWMLDRTIPNLINAAETVLFARALTVPSHHTLNSLHSHFAGTVGEEAYAKFADALKVLGDEIDERNAKLIEEGQPPYPYLHPSIVPASVEI